MFIAGQYRSTEKRYENITSFRKYYILKFKLKFIIFVSIFDHFQENYKKKFEQKKYLVESEDYAKEPVIIKYFL